MGGGRDAVQLRVAFTRVRVAVTACRKRINDENRVKLRRYMMIHRNEWSGKTLDNFHSAVTEIF